MAMKEPFTIKSLELVLGTKADSEMGAEELMVRVVAEVVATEAVDLVVIIMPGAKTERTLHRTCGPIGVIEPVVALLLTFPVVALLACPVVSSGSGNL